MDKLSELRVPSEWEAALTACLDDAPRHTYPHRVAWVAALALALAGLGGAALWFFH
jgi:hypothetical protein